MLYQRVRNLALAWKIIPIIGDLKDPEFGKRFANWEFKEEPVRAIYTSNVENYLVTRGSWENYSNFVHSLQQLPKDPNAVIIKAYFQYSDLKHPLQLDGRHECVFVHKVSDLFDAFDNNKLQNPSDIFLKIPYTGPTENTIF